MAKRVVRMTLLVAITALIGTVWLSPILVAGAARPDDQAAMLSSRSTLITVFNDINSLRSHFHLVTGRRTTAYQPLVVHAAQALSDPSLGTLSKGVLGQYGVWGAESATNGAPLNPVDLVSTWVYNDGWEGTNTANVDCTGPTAPGCNDHRRYILSAPPAKGATLTIDVAVVNTTVDQQPAVSVAAILTWSVA